MEPLLTLFDDRSPADEVVGLTTDLQAIYGGDLVLPAAHADRPYGIANFVASIDGLTSFALPNHDTGGEISGGSEIDHAVMGILRSLADAVVWGGKTYVASQRFVPTPAAIWRPGAELFAAQRERLGKPPTPLAVIVSASGVIPLDGAILTRAEQPAIIATTDAGTARLGDLTASAPNMEIWSFGATVPPLALAQRLFVERGVRLLLCEGGPTLFGGCLEAGIIDELFLTRAPQLVGRSVVAPRPGLVAGIAFTPAEAPWARLLSLKRSGNYLFECYAIAIGPRRDD